MNKRRKILAAMLAAFMLLVPMVSTAQIDIKGDDDPNANFTGTFGTMQITDNETGDYVPLGEGLWLLAGAAGLYLLVKSRKTRKATAVTAAALALTLGTTQCKKTEESVIPAGETISISFMAGNGAKADIDVDHGRITWNKDDKVYVVCNNANPNAVLLGEYLTAQTDGGQETEISGEVIVPEDYTLPTNPSFTFYYVGSGVTFDKANFTFDISKQNGQNGVDLNDSGEYMVGRTGAVEMEMDVDDGKYGPVDPGAKHFDPLTSVLRLDTKEFGAGQLTMSGGNSKMTIDLGTTRETITYTPGYITFTSGEDVQISVLPTTAGDATLDFWGNGMEGSITVTNGIKAGRIYSKVTNNAGYPIPVEAEAETDLLPGKFSVSATKYVQFSIGNLQFKAGDGSVESPEWRFAEHQYDYIGNAAGNTTVATSRATQSAWIDLFGWGATGRTDINTNLAQPYESSQDNPKYKTEASATVNETLTRENGGDWGVCMGEGWLTLSTAEWQYLFGNSAERKDKYKYGVTVCGKANCLILVPDVLDGYTFDKSKTSYTANEWATAEAAGLVCLPPLGWRGGSEVKNSGSRGYYWSSSAYNEKSDTRYASYVFFTNSEVGSDFYDNRYEGRSVRLVKKFEKPVIQPTFVDLGLPSGTQWATCNLGAEHPYDYGNYYAWGETAGYNEKMVGDGANSSASYSPGTVKTDYSWAYYKWGSGEKNLGKYVNKTGYGMTPPDNKTVLDLEDDAARANWGGDWRMPTTAEWKELYDNTECTWTTENSVTGRKFTSKKDSSKYIFLPAAGYRSGASLSSEGSYGHYWSGSLNSSDPSCACYMYFHSGGVDPQNNYYRRIGYSVRPVCAAPN